MPSTAGRPTSAADPDSEIITNTTVTAGNKGDAGAAASLLEDIATDVPEPGDDSAKQSSPGRQRAGAGGGGEGHRGTKRPTNKRRMPRGGPLTPPSARPSSALVKLPKRLRWTEEATPAVYGDAAYGAAALLAYLDENGIDPRVKVQPPVVPGGFLQGPLQDRLGSRVSHVPGRQYCRHFLRQGWRRHRLFQLRVQQLPAAPVLHTAGAGPAPFPFPPTRPLQAQRGRCADPSFTADYRATRPKSSASLLTSCSVATGGAGHASVAGARSTPISTFSRRRGTWPVSPSSGCSTAAVG